MKPFQNPVRPQYPRRLKTVCVFILFAALCAMPDARSVQAETMTQASATPPTDGQVGANYTPADADHGLRIDVTDTDEPILSGAIGVRVHRVPAWFDNVVVLPAGMLP